MKNDRNKNNKRRKPKVCYYTQTGTMPDYKEVLVLKRFINDRGKVLPKKYSGLTAKFQRLAATEIKKARFMGLLQYTDRHAI